MKMGRCRIDQGLICSRLDQQPNLVVTLFGERDRDKEREREIDRRGGGR